MDTKTTPVPAERYIEAVGRRKTAVARVRLVQKKGLIHINERGFKEYFPQTKQQELVLAPLELVGVSDKMTVTAHVHGGGMIAQAEAVRHGISRALVKLQESLRPKLRVVGFLTRDPRMVERKKYGLKKARRAPQWAKR